MTPMKAIRAKCLDCCCGQFKEVRLCTCENCPLYPYRMGRRPKTGADTFETATDKKATASPAIFERQEVIS